MHKAEYYLKKEVKNKKFLIIIIKKKNLVEMFCGNQIKTSNKTTNNRIFKFVSISNPARLVEM
jgi:hypothetical protein